MRKLWEDVVFWVVVFWLLVLVCVDRVMVAAQASQREFALSEASIEAVCRHSFYRVQDEAYSLFRGGPCEQAGVVAEYFEYGGWGWDPAATVVCMQSREELELRFGRPLVCGRLEGER